jgi:hypothetical protein
MSRKLQVLVVFEFGGISDPDSVEAEIVTDEVEREVKRIVQGDWESPIESVTAWVQGATMVEEV